MKVLIIEDEIAAAQQLSDMVHALRPDWTIVGIMESIVETVDFLKNNAPDLILIDIHLSDGESFSIFEQVKVESPVIFTTAFDEYAIRAFKVHSIDYLLKPIEDAELVFALEKYEQLYPTKPDNTFLQAKMVPFMEQVQKRDRILVTTYNGLKSIECTHIAYVKALEKKLYVYTFDGDVNVMDRSLDELSDSFPEKTFFRINRKYLSNIKALQEIRPQTGGRIRVALLHSKDDKIYVSQSRIQDFRRWLDS